MQIINMMFILAALCMGNTYAETIEGIKPILKYDLNYYSTYNNKNFDSKYLVVVPEKWSFPKGRQYTKFKRALDILPEVMNSEKFKLKVLSYVNSDGKRQFQKNYLWSEKTRRLTNEEVYRLIIEGNEYKRPNSIGEMNLNSYVKICRWYEQVTTWCRAVIGSTNPSQSKWIRLNWKFYSHYNVDQMVSNLVHEWLHLLGFLHGNKNMREEVPYVVGAIAGEVTKEILSEHGLEN